MKKVTLLFILVLLLGLNACSKESDELRIGIEAAYPPFSKTLPDGSFAGFDIDIANALCTELNRKCKLIKQNWDGLIPALSAKKFDAIVASMSITEERKRKVSFTDKYYSAPLTFIATKGKFDDFSEADLKGKTIGVQRSTVMDKFVTGNFIDKGVGDIKRYATQEDAYLDLISGRLDFICVEIITGADFLKTEKGQNFEFVGAHYSDPKWIGEGIGIAVRKDDTKLVEDLNKAIKAIRANGTYQKIQSKYFDFDIYGD